MSNEVELDAETATTVREWALDSAVRSLQDSPMRADEKTVIEKAKRYEQYILTGE
jgi:hypothetical protein